METAWEAYYTQDTPGSSIFVPSPQNGQNGACLINSNNYTFNGGVAAPATNTTYNITLPGNTIMPLQMTIPNGGQIQVQYNY
jgi:hypothetical protein